MTQTDDRRPTPTDVPIGVTLSRTCQGCGTDFEWTSTEGHQWPTSYCTRTCVKQAMRRRVIQLDPADPGSHDAHGELQILTCARCQRPFGWKPPAADEDPLSPPMYHSISCQEKARVDRRTAARAQHKAEAAARRAQRTDPEPRELSCTRCGASFTWMPPADQPDAPTPGYCSDRCRQKAQEHRRRVRDQAAGGDEPEVERDATAHMIITAALAEIETVEEDAIAREHFHLARACGATARELYRAWRRRYERDNYRQQQPPPVERVTVCVTGKLRWPTREDAGAALNRLLRIRAVRDQVDKFEQRSYACDRCDGWHLTSAPLRPTDR